MHFSILLSRATSYVKGILYSIPKTNFAQKIAFALLLPKNDKKQSKSKSKSPKTFGRKRNFSPFRTGSEIIDLLGHVTMT